MPNMGFRYTVGSTTSCMAVGESISVQDPPCSMGKEGRFQDEVLHTPWGEGSSSKCRESGFKTKSKKGFILRPGLRMGLHQFAVHTQMTYPLNTFPHSLCNMPHASIHCMRTPVSHSHVLLLPSKPMFMVLPPHLV